MVVVKNLNKYFYRHKNNEIHVINDASIEFPLTGLVAILGESGSGKTTLLNVIGGLDEFSSGKIKIDDFEITKYSSRKMDRIRNEKIGYIFQNYVLLTQRTVYYNLHLALSMYDLDEKEKEERIDYVLKAVGMLRYKKKNVNELSGGQQQRIAIARALIKSPSMILADEPTGNLDEKNTIQIMNIIKKISKKILVIMVSHEKNIAKSYADYIINVSDGKIESKKENETSSYKYQDDQTLYLKEYSHQLISNDVVNIDFYHNLDAKINLKIVYENDKYYISSSEKIILLDDEKEIKMVDEKRKDLVVDDEIFSNDYHLEEVPYKKNPKLSLKDIFKLAMTNLNKSKKKLAFLSLTLFIISVLTIIGIQSIISGSRIDRKNIVGTDSRLYNASIEQAQTYVNTIDLENIYEDIYDNVKENVPEATLVFKSEYNLFFYLPSFTQFASSRYTISGFSFMPLEALDEEKIIFGRLPEKIDEIVVEKWVLEKALSDSTLANFMNVSSFLNQTITVQHTRSNYKIVGISDQNQNSIYLNKWMILSIIPSEVKKAGQVICPLSEYNKFTGENTTLNDNEAIINPTMTYSFDDLYIGTSNNVVYRVVGETRLKDVPFNVVLNDSQYENILKYIFRTNKENATFFVENTNVKEKLANYLDSIKDYKYYKTVLDDAGEEVKEEISVLINHQSDYDNTLAPYVLEAQNLVSTRLLIILTIVFTSFIIVFFTMKSYVTKNIYDIGVYRAIGINKRSIVLVYVIEVLTVSLKTTFVGCTLCYLVTNFISSIPLASIDFSISIEFFLLCVASLITINVFAGVLPIIGYMRLTPSQLLSKYDI